MSQIKQIYTQVSNSHPGLEKYFVTSLISVLGNKGVLLIGEQGSGKSNIAISIAKILSPFFYIYSKDQLTLHGLMSDDVLRAHKKVFCLVDDYSASGTKYARLNLLSTLCVLNFKGMASIQKKDIQKSLSFEKFVYIICIQPIWLHEILNTEEFRGLLSDKTVRLYILNRPVKINTDLINVNVTINETEEITKIPKKAMNALENLKFIYSEARAHETLLALLNGIKRLDGKLENWHYTLLNKITELIALERHFIRHRGELKALDFNLIRITGMFTKLDKFTIKDFAKEYKLSEEYARKILERYKNDIYRNSDTYKLLEFSRINNYLKILNEPWL